MRGRCHSRKTRAVHVVWARFSVARPVAHFSPTSLVTDRPRSGPCHTPTDTPITSGNCVSVGLSLIFRQRFSILPLQIAAEASFFTAVVVNPYEQAGPMAHPPVAGIGLLLVLWALGTMLSSGRAAPRTNGAHARWLQYSDPRMALRRKDHRRTALETMKYMGSRRRCRVPRSSCKSSPRGCASGSAATIETPEEPANIAGFSRLSPS